MFLNSLSFGEGVGERFMAQGHAHAHPMDGSGLFFLRLAKNL